LLGLMKRPAALHK